MSSSAGQVKCDSKLEIAILQYFKSFRKVYMMDNTNGPSMGMTVHYLTPLYFTSHYYLTLLYLTSLLYFMSWIVQSFLSCFIKSASNLFGRKATFIHLCSVQSTRTKLCAVSLSIIKRKKGFYFSISSV